MKNTKNLLFSLMLSCAIIPAIAQPYGPGPAPVVSAVSSVFGRTGVVVATTNDYAITQISGLGTGVATLLSGTPSGTGGPVGTTSPTLITPVLGVATGTSFGLTGNQSASGIFGANGIRYKNVAGTLTDTTSSGTIANNYDSVFGGNTLTATGATTITNNYGSFFKNPICSTNVTCTVTYALGADSLNILNSGVFGGALSSNGISVSNTAYLGFSSRGSIFASADGVWNFENDAGTGFTRVQLGGTTSSFPSIKRNSTALNFRLADDSADASVTAASLTNSGALIAAGSAPTATGTCTRGAQTGGNTTGTIVLTCTAQTVILTFATTAPTGWMCEALDQTTVADTMKQTSNSTTSCTLTGTTAASDAIYFQARAF